MWNAVVMLDVPGSLLCADNRLVPGSHITSAVCEAVRLLAKAASQDCVSRVHFLCRSTLMVATTPLKGPRRLALS